MRSYQAIINRILAARGVEDSAEFFSDRPRETHDPFLLPDMAAGAELVFRHISEGKKICVYGDYDVDGLMSVTLLSGFLEALPVQDAGATQDSSLGGPPPHDSGKITRNNISWYIPSRFDEGFGLNIAALKQIRDTGADLVITVDCGISSPVEIAAAKDMGMEILVTDHHEPDGDSPIGCPAIDPKRADSRYPFSGLCGCGVAFKLAQAIKNRYYPNDPAVKSAVTDSLDLVAVATIADVMPLRGENRTLVKYGMNALNAGKRWQLRALAEGIELKMGSVSAYNIAFGVAPHLNAAGRMGDPSLAVELFKTDDRARADEIIKELISRNKERRREQDEAVSACEQIIDAEYANDGFLLVRPPYVHEGVSGIVAGRIKEKYGRPSAVLAEACGESTGGAEDCGDSTESTGGAALKGSARSVAGIDIISMLRSHGELFTKLGGHAMAAGFTFPAAHEDALRKALCADVKALADKNPELLSPPPSADADIESGEATLELAAALEKFEPTGAGNHKPTLCLRGQVPAGIRRMGQDGKHMRFTAGGLPCVMFANAGSPAELDGGDSPEGIRQGFDLYGTLEINRWNGRESVQFIVREAVVRK
ncbi:MAG: DHH family phosphoesterase [Clostridiales Family XIII bacterium]|nr:DHH family phosphoesterase [Clostridiales Family XIII bacterium]